MQQTMENWQFMILFNFNVTKIQITKFAHPNRSSEGLPFFKCKAPLFIQPPSKWVWVSRLSHLQGVRSIRLS